MARRKVNPKSLENLTHEGRPTVYEEKKTTHNVSVTPTGWVGVQNLTKSLGYSSVSEFVEQLGRGQIHVDQQPSSQSEVHSQVSGSFGDIAKFLLDCEARNKEFMTKQLEFMTKRFTGLENKLTEFLDRENKLAEVLDKKIGELEVQKSSSNTQKPISAVKEDLETILTENGTHTLESQITIKEVLECLPTIVDNGV